MQFRAPPEAFVLAAPDGRDQPTVAPAPLGLDHPLQLRGGDRMGPGGLPEALALDWLPELAGLVARHCCPSAGWFRLPPVALCGDTALLGIEFARSVARTAGVPLVVMNLAERPHRRTWGEPEWMRGVFRPCPVATAMAGSGCANPLVLVEGLRHAPSCALNRLAALLDPEACRAAEVEGLELHIDYGHVTWLVDTGPSADLPDQVAPLLRSIRVDLGRVETARLFVLFLIGEMLERLPSPNPLDPDLVERLVSRTVRNVYRLSGTEGADKHARDRFFTELWHSVISGAG